MNSIEGNINGFGYKKPDIESWKEQSNKYLKQKDYPYIVVGNGNYIFLQIFTILFFIGILVLGIFFIYYTGQGKFQDINNQPINVTNDYDPTTNNAYDFKPVSNFYNNFTLKLDDATIIRLCNSS
ncbi:MAG: hypothetical protein AABW67_04195 [Nanoarchaeota archaeon]